MHFSGLIDLDEITELLFYSKIPRFPKKGQKSNLSFFKDALSGKIRELYHQAEKAVGLFTMKLFIQVPCFNEEKTLGQTLAALPKSVPGFDEVRVLVIDDGSTDRTVEIARECGVEHVVSFKGNRGLAAAFSAGIEECLRLGGDVIVNTDADNQYDASCIPDLVAPIVEGKADVVVGARDMDAVAHFSPLKRWLQKIGSIVVGRLSGTDVRDATSGFRAFSREAAKAIIVHSEYTYTLETLIQAGRRDFVVTSVPVRTNPKTRESRLMDSTPQYLVRSAATLFRIYTLYRPLRVFAALGGVSFLFGLLIGLRFLYYYFATGGQGHVQSLILGATLMILGFLLFILGVVADLLAANRRLLEDLRLRIRSLEELERKRRD
jgi:glycosyltransferase involved in cell wall biosynthesis